MMMMMMSGGKRESDINKCSKKLSQDRYLAKGRPSHCSSHCPLQSLVKRKLSLRCQEGFVRVHLIFISEPRIS